LPPDRPSPLDDFRLALAFLTRLPLPPPSSEGSAFGRALIWYPAVGLLIGGCLLAGGWLLQHFFSPLITAGWIIAWWALLTGFLHLDGLGDCWDALFPPLAPERRLQVLKDPHLGTFGTVGLILHLLLKTSAALAVLAEQPLGLLLAPLLARWAVLWLGKRPAARPEGLGAAFHQALSPRTLFMSSLLPLLILPLGGLHSLLALGFVAAALWGLSALAQRHLGGISGDVLGAAIEISELLTLLAFSLRLSW